MSSLGLVDDLELGIFDSEGGTFSRELGKHEISEKEIQEGGIEKDTNNTYFKPLTFSDIIPNEGLFLGLDVSKNSTGLTIIENGSRVSGNISLEEEKAKGVHKEVLFRRLLKEYLTEVVGGKHFDLIIIEDAFVGENAETVRLLFSLNTAIDELILDGVCSCSKFVRVSNQSWKSWLYSLDTLKVTRGYKDKEKIRYCLNSIGIFEDGEGAQDRLDSTGLLVGYFLKGKGLSQGGKVNKKVRFSDVRASYDVFEENLFYSESFDDDTNFEFIDTNRITKSKVLELLRESPSTVYITKNPVALGNLGDELGLCMFDTRGYFAFWVDRKRLARYT